MNTRCAIPLIVFICAAMLLAAPVRPCRAQRLDRKTHEEQHDKVLKWAMRNGALIKGLTKNEVLKIYGFPDKKFVRTYSTGRVEQWTYYHPRKRAVLPYKSSPFSARFRFLYFRDDILVNFER